jgi:hypothetical protein
MEALLIYVNHKYPRKRNLDFAIIECIEEKNIITPPMLMEYLQTKTLTDAYLLTWFYKLGHMEDAEFFKTFVTKYPDLLTSENNVENLFFQKEPISEQIAMYLFSLNHIVIRRVVMPKIVIYPNILLDRLNAGWRMADYVDIRNALLDCLRQKTRDSFILMLKHHDMHNEFIHIYRAVLRIMNVRDVELMEIHAPHLLTNTIKKNFVISNRKWRPTEIITRFIPQIILPIDLAYGLLTDSLYWGNESIAMHILERYPQMITLRLINETLDLFTMLQNKSNAYKDRYMTFAEYDRVFTSMIKQARIHTVVLLDYIQVHLCRPSLNLIKKASRDGNPRACEILMEYAVRDPRESRSAWLRWAAKKAQYEMIDQLIDKFPATEHAQALEWASGQWRDPVTKAVKRFNFNDERINDLFMVLAISKSIRTEADNPDSIIIDSLDHQDIKDRVEAGRNELLDRECNFVRSLLTIHDRIGGIEDLFSQILRYSHSEATLLLRVCAFYGKRVERLIKLLRETNRLLNERNIHHRENAVLDIIREVQEGLS